MSRLNSMSCIRAVLRRTGVIVLALVAMALVGPSIALAQQTDADFSAYCRANFSNSTYQSFAQSWGTEHACVQGGTRQGIDFSAACLITTGSREHVVSGARVLCAGDPGDAPAANANDLGALDLVQYCVENFPNSAYERRSEATGFEHYCRRPGLNGGFTLQPVDLFSACRAAFGSQSFRKDGVQVFCTQDSASGTSGGTGGAGGAGGGSPDQPPFPLPNEGPGPFPPAPPQPFPAPNPDDDPLDAPAPENPESQACMFIGGAWHSGTLPIVDDLIEDMGQSLAKCTAGPLCPAFRVQVAVETYIQTTMVWQCHLFFIKAPEGKSSDNLKTAAEEACAIEPTLDLLAEQVNALGGSMSFPFHKMILDTQGLSSLCDCDLEVDDFAAMVRELQEDAENELKEEFAE